MSLDWYVVVAKPGHDYLVERGLLELGCEDVYLAQTFARLKTEIGMRPVPDLVYSPYVFAECDVSKGQHSNICGTRGVKTIFQDSDNVPVPLRNGKALILSWRLAENQEKTAARSAPVCALKRGMWVRIDKPGIVTRDRDGEFVPMVGVISLLKKKKVEILVGTKACEVDYADVTEVPCPF